MSTVRGLHREPVLSVRSAVARRPRRILAAPEVSTGVMALVGGVLLAVAPATTGGPG
jgi:hypothetical protein